MATYVFLVLADILFSVFMQITLENVHTCIMPMKCTVDNLKYIIFVSHISSFTSIILYFTVTFFANDYEVLTAN